MTCDAPCPGLMHSYFLYSAILALKLLALSPLAVIVNRRQKLQQANISDLKNLTPFWLVAALYVTTCPDECIAVMLLRTYVLARMVAAVGYIIELPCALVEGAFILSFAITTFMGGMVVYYYRASM